MADHGQNRGRGRPAGAGRADGRRTRRRRTATAPALAAEIEARWQDRWEAERTFEAPNPAGPLADPDRVGGRPKLFILDMFPYPSGAGLHVGHPLGYIGTDVFGRYRRMKGFNVLHALGYDAFGLPAEQYAIETGTHPRVTTEENVANFRRQLRRLGLAHDARRSVSTTDESYYRWTQWIFLQIFDSWYDAEQGRARPIDELRAELAAGSPPDARRSRRGPSSAAVEQRGGGRRPPPGLHRRGAGQLVPGPGHRAGQRGGHRRRPLRPRQLPGVPAQHAAVDDADHRLRRPPDRRPGLARLARVDQDHAAQLDRALRRAPRSTSPSGAGPIEVFTTRPDTLFGATFMVLAPEHPLVDALTAAAWPERTRPLWTGTHATPAEAVAAYRAAAAAKTDLDRQAEDREKTGVFTGSFALNPVNDELIPIFIADYVLMGYGTGAIMAVPGQDERDWEFAGALRPAHRAHRAAARRLGGRRPTWARARPSTAPRHPGPRRHGGRRGQARHDRLAGGQRAGPGHHHLPAAGLAVQPPALLGRAVPDRLRRDRPAHRPARVACCPSRCPTLDDFRPRVARPRRRGVRAGAAAGRGSTGGPTSSWTWATGRSATGAS